jgi:hypothetical protein
MGDARAHDPAGTAVLDRSPKRPVDDVRSKNDNAGETVSADDVRSKIVEIAGEVRPKTVSADDVTGLR